MQHWIDYEKRNKDKIQKADELIKIQETVLNMLKEQDKEIEKKNKDIHHMQELLDISDANNVKKDKIINEMALYFNTGLSMCEDCEKCFEYEDIYKFCKDCIKQYFERRSEE